MGELDQVDERLATAFGQANKAVVQAGYGFSLAVTSGYRSPEKQRALRTRYLAGDRVGLTSEPAADSRHSQGRAIDVAFRYQGQLVPIAATPRWAFEELAEFMAPWGVRWGGRWRSPSPNHYEV